MNTLAQCICGMDHLALELSDLNEGVRFFSDILGFAPRFEVDFEAHHIIQLKAGQLDIEIWQAADPDTHAANAGTGTVHHIGIKVKNLEQALSAARQADIPVILDAYSPTDGIQEAIIRGPDGMRIQLVEQNLPLLIWRSLRGDFKKPQARRA